MRIVHVTSYVPPGYGYEEVNLARAQRKLGHESFVVTSNFLHQQGLYSVLEERFPQRQVSPSTEEDGGVPVIRLASLEVMRRPWLHGLRSKIEELNPDVIHCHNLMQFHPVRLAEKRERRPYALVVDDHMTSVFRREGGAADAYYAWHRRIVQPWLEERVDGFYAISGAARSYLAEHCGVRREIGIMPLGVDAELFRPLPRQAGENRVVLYAGKVIEDKGVHLLAEAAAMAGARVTAVGDADPEYAGRLREAGVNLLPSVGQEDLAQVFADADVAVWPRQESMGVFQAMACGVPVVVADSSSNADIVRAGAGLTFEDESTEDLGRVLSQLLEPGARERYGSCGRRLVEERFTWEGSAQRYLDEYSRFL